MMSSIVAVRSVPPLPAPAMVSVSPMAKPAVEATLSSLAPLAMSMLPVSEDEVGAAVSTDRVWAATVTLTTLFSVSVPAAASTPVIVAVRVVPPTPALGILILSPTAKPVTLLTVTVADPAFAEPVADAVAGVTTLIATEPTVVLAAVPIVSCLRALSITVIVAVNVAPAGPAPGMLMLSPTASPLTSSTASSVVPAFKSMLPIVEACGKSLPVALAMPTTSLMLYGWITTLTPG